ncbi:MAG: hypothetical protein OCC49_01180 [Fibrobacterales bacterium]
MIKRITLLGLALSIFNCQIIDVREGEEVGTESSNYSSIEYESSESSTLEDYSSDEQWSSENEEDHWSCDISSEEWSSYSEESSDEWVSSSIDMSSWLPPMSSWVPPTSSWIPPMSSWVPHSSNVSSSSIVVYSSDISSSSIDPGLATFVDPRDGEVYPLTTINEQVWFAKNLNYSGDNGQGGKEDRIGKCWGSDDQSDTEYCDRTGRLYMWAELSNENLCPVGWHVPEPKEWLTMTDYVYLNSNGDIVNALKAGWGWDSPYDSTGADLYGFSAVANSELGRLEPRGAEFWAGYLESAPQNSLVRVALAYYQNDHIAYFGANRSSSEYGIRCLQDGITIIDEPAVINHDPGFVYQSVDHLTGEFVDARDGQEYPFTQVGSQTWMAANLNYSGDDGEGNKTVDVGNCFGSDDTEETENCDLYGRLYVHDTAMGRGYTTVPGQGLCPEGWRVPLWEDWEELEEYVDARNGSHVGARSLKATTGWSSIYNRYANGTDVVGMNLQSYDKTNGMAHFWMKSLNSNRSSTVVVGYYGTHSLGPHTGSQGPAVMRCIYAAESFAQ